MDVGLGTPIAAAVSSSSYATDNPVVAAILANKWKTEDGKPLTPELFQQAIEMQKKHIVAKTLTPAQLAFLSQIEKSQEEVTAHDFVKKYGGKGNVPLSEVPTRPLFRKDFDENKTRAYALKYFRLGCDPSQKEAWMDCFGKDAVYVIADKEYVCGKENIKTHLRAMFASSPPLTFTMYSLEIKGNRAIATLGNDLKDGNSFLLTSIDYFDDNGDVIFNMDCYNFYAAAAEVVHDIITKDGKIVAKQQIDSFWKAHCTLI